jgi:hypothetical protein
MVCLTPSSDFLPKSVAQRLVRIKAQHVVEFCLIRRPILLVCVRRPSAMNHAGTHGFAQGLGAIGRP